jgi:hypothetical protein
LKRALPRDLNEVAQFVAEEEHRATLNLSDPQTGKRYGYTVKNDSTFEICAQFSLDERSQSDAWNHPAGEHCFTIDLLKQPANGFP